jgi:hypothetical protein
MTRVQNRIHDDTPVFCATSLRATTSNLRVWALYFPPGLNLIAYRGSPSAGGAVSKCKEIVRKVQAMHDAGLAYLTFGQPLSPFSVEEGCWRAPPGRITEFHQ